MANKRFRGDCKKLKQVEAYTITAYDAATTYTYTMGGKAYSVIAQGSAALTASGLQAALAAALDGEFLEVTWAYSSGDSFTGTAKTAGKPFTGTLSKSGGTGTVSTTVTTANSGPNDISIAGNWSPSGLPAGLLTTPVQNNPSATSGGSLANGTTYYWVITAINENGETVKSNEKSLAISNPNNTAALTWDSVPGATGYKVYRSTSAGTYGATSLVTTISSGSTTTYSDTGTALTSGAPPGVSTATADDVFFDEMAKADALYGLDALTGRVFNTLNVIGYRYKIGLPEHTGTYWEYRPVKLEHRSTTVNIDAAAVVRCKLKQMATCTTLNVRNTGTGIDGQKALMLDGSTITTLVVQKGDVGLALQSGETLTFTTLRMGHVSNLTGDAKVEGGTGLTVGTVDKQGGKLELNSAVGTSLTNWAGDVTINGTGAVAQLTAYAGTITYNTTGALGGNTVLTESANGAAVLDFSQDPAAKTVTNPIEVQSSRCRIRDPNKVVTTLVVDYNYASVPGLDIGTNIRVTRGAPA